MSYPTLINQQHTSSQEINNKSSLHPTQAIHDKTIITSQQTQQSSSRSQTQTPPNTKSPSSSAPITTRTPSISSVGNGPWSNYQFPSNWELSDDFMCVHFIPRTADKHTWNSQCSFWNEAISMYAQQLLSTCPHQWNRLTFTPKDIITAYTRKNRLTPMCIIDILKWMKYNKKTVQFAAFIENNYKETGYDDGINQNDSILSISGMSNMVSSVFGYLMSSNTNSDDEDDFDDNSDEAKVDIKADTKCIYLPILNELCEKLSNLKFYKQEFNDKSDLKELIDIGIIQFDNTQNTQFIINGLVFYRFCVEILRLTVFDILILKKYLIFNGKISLFYLNENVLNNADDINANFTKELNENISEYHDLKNEMIYFKANINDTEKITNEEMAKMQLISIQMTMKHLKFEKNENENNLHEINNKLLSQLKNIKSTEKRKQFMASNVTLIKRKKWLKNRISNLDGSIYNLETTLHSMQDMNINKMVFNEMKNADKMLKAMIKATPSIEEIETMHEDIKESMDINTEIGDVLARPMDTDDIDIDDDDLLKEYDELEMKNTEESLPDAPNHDIIIKDAGTEKDDDTEVVDRNDDMDDIVVEKEQDKEVLMN